ncbi:unnamed protein product [Cunninghamella echinulata]
MKVGLITLVLLSLSCVSYIQAAPVKNEDGVVDRLDLVKRQLVEIDDVIDKAVEELDAIKGGVDNIEDDLVPMQDHFLI